MHGKAESTSQPTVCRPIRQGGGRASIFSWGLPCTGLILADKPAFFLKNRQTILNLKFARIRENSRFPLRHRNCRRQSQLKLKPHLSAFAANSDRLIAEIDIIPVFRSIGGRSLTASGHWTAQSDRLQLHLLSL